METVMPITKVEWDYPDPTVDSGVRVIVYAEVCMGEMPGFVNAKRIAVQEAGLSCYLHTTEDDRPRWYFVRFIGLSGNVLSPIGAQATPID